MNLTPEDINALIYIQKYNYLTIDQIHRLTHFTKSKQITQRHLLQLQEHHYIDFFGRCWAGLNRVPKVYYLLPAGYDLLVDEGFSQDLLGVLKRKHKPVFSPRFNHRLKLIDILISLEVSLRTKPHYELVKIFLEYNRVKNPAGKLCSETEDYFNEQHTPENRLIPDAAFILKNTQSNAQGLHFLEIDLGTETILSQFADDSKFTLWRRLKQYDQYLISGKYAEKYHTWGDFEFFRLLFVTNSATRRDNIRKEISKLSAEYHVYYFFNTYTETMQEFFNDHWKIRSLQDHQDYSLLKQP